MKIKINKNENYLIALILIFYFLLNYYQLNFQHWSSLIDHDLYILYNSLLISSGLEQEGRDHPAFITFLIHGFIFKISALINNNLYSDLNEIFNSSEINRNLQFFFEVSRFTNFFINLILFFVFYKFLKLLKVDYKNIFLYSLIILISNWYTLSFFALRSENLSLIFVILSLIFIISDSKNDLKNYFISGIFFLLAMLTKIQIVFFLIYIIFFIGKIHNRNEILKQKFFSINLNEKYFLYLLILIFGSYILFQLKIQEFPRFEKNKYLDLFIFSFFMLLTFFYFIISSSFKKDIFIKKTILLSSFLQGFIFCLLFFLFLDTLNILPVNDFIYLRITNPFHYLTEFQATFADGIINIKFLLVTLLEVFKSYDQSLIEFFLLFFLLFLSLKKIFDKEKKIAHNILILFGIFFLITTINGFRGGHQYHIYYTFCFLTVLAFIQDQLKNKLSSSIAIIIALVFLMNNNLLKAISLDSGDRYSQIFERKNLMIEVCNEFLFNIIPSTDDGSVRYIKYRQNRFDDKVINKICKELGIQN